MVALITANSLARPLSFTVAGALLASLGLRPTFLILAAGLTGAAALFSAVVAREPKPEVIEQARTT